MAVNGGVAAFAPRGRSPHISKAFRRVGIERLSLVGLSWKDDKQGVPGGLHPPLARNVLDSIDSPHRSNSIHN